MLDFIIFISPLIMYFIVLFSAVNYIDKNTKI
nr:MAG TPA: hypothetical protein [Caudoviricetes sp.]